MNAEIAVHGSFFSVRCPYSPVLIDRFRLIPGGEFRKSDKAWLFPSVRDCIFMLCDAVGMLPFMLPAELRTIVESSGRLLESKPLDLSVLEGHTFLTTPYEHQRKNVARLLQEPRWLLGDQMGTGKSMCIANRLKSLPERSLIVCPKSVLGGWIEQLDKHAGLKGFIIDCNFEPEDLPAGHVFVTNYERLLTSAEAFHAIPWTCLVADEIHRLKSFTAQTSKVFRKLSGRASYVYGLSGTPAPNGLEDWFGVLSALNPDLLPCQTKTAFEARYCTKSQLGSSGIWKITGYRNVEELHQYISSCTSRVTKEDCLDLPPKVFTSRLAALTGEQARVYRALKKDAVARLQSLRKEGTLTIQNVLSESLRLLQVVGGFVPDDEKQLHELNPKAKVEALREVLDEAGGRQAVIWCTFRPEVAYLEKWLAKEYRCEVATLVGGMTSEQREEGLKAFREGQARYFVGTDAAGGTGINGLHVADLEIYYSRGFNLANYLQSQDRLHRLGQKRTVQIVKLIAPGTVDQRVDEALDKKASLQEMMLQDPKEFL